MRTQFNMPMFMNYCVNMVKNCLKHKHEIRIAILVISRSNCCLASHLQPWVHFMNSFITDGIHLPSTVACVKA